MTLRDLLKRTPLFPPRAKGPVYAFTAGALAPILKCSRQTAAEMLSGRARVSARYAPMLEDLSRGRLRARDLLRLGPPRVPNHPPTPRTG